jgi:hypothetical protein
VAYSVDKQLLGILSADLRVKLAGFGKLPSLEEPIGRIDF